MIEGRSAWQEGEEQPDYNSHGRCIWLASKYATHSVEFMRSGNHVGYFPVLENR